MMKLIICIFSVYDDMIVKEGNEFTRVLSAVLP